MSKIEESIYRVASFQNHVKKTIEIQEKVTSYFENTLFELRSVYDSNFCDTNTWRYLERFKTTAELQNLTEHIVFGMRTKKSLENYFEFDTTLNISHDHELALSEIERFEAFIAQKELNCSRKISAQESRLIAKIETAIALYRNTPHVRFYRLFRLAISDYYKWLYRKLYKGRLYIRHLYRKLTLCSIVEDARKKIRDILRFRSRQLVDEDNFSNRIGFKIKDKFNLLSTSSYESHTHYTNSKKSGRGTLIQYI